MKPTRPLGWNPTTLAPLTLLAVLTPLALASCATPVEGMEKEMKPGDLAALKATGAKANGLVVWTSSRAGLPHLFTMKTDGSEARQLTKGDTTDWHPRFSPDGRKILFSRSQDPGFVRQADAAAGWDLYTIDVNGGALTKVASDALWGSWNGPDEIVFVRGSRIMRVKVGSEEVTKIMDTAHYPLFDGVTVEQPELSHDGHFLALTLTGKHREVGLWNIKKKTWTQMGQGAQIAWAPDGASVYWVDDAGKDGSRIAREPVVAGTPADEQDPEKILLVDLPGKRSRERFPRLSTDGKWLVFASAINHLEDDLEDYELFLWEAGTPATGATRLTFHSANDSWPDVFTGGVAEAAPQRETEETKAGADEQGGDKTDKTAASEDEATKAEPAEAGPAKAATPAADADADESPPPAASTPKHTAKGKKKKR